MQEKNRPVTVKLNTKEYTKFQKVADRLDMTVSDCVRVLVKDVNRGNVKINPACAVNG